MRGEGIALFHEECSRNHRFRIGWRVTCLRSVISCIQFQGFIVLAERTRPAAYPSPGKTFGAPSVSQDIVARLVQATRNLVPLELTTPNRSRPTAIRAKPVINASVSYARFENIRFYCSFAFSCRVSKPDRLSHGLLLSRWNWEWPRTLSWRYFQRYYRRKRRFPMLTLSCW